MMMAGWSKHAFVQTSKWLYIFYIEGLITKGGGGDLNIEFYSISSIVWFIWVTLIEKQYFHIRGIHCIMYEYTKWDSANFQCFSNTVFIRVWSLDPDQQNIVVIIFSKPTTANINLTCKFPPPQRDLSRMAPMLTVPEASFSQPASFSLLLQILQRALPLNQCSLPKNSSKILDPLRVLDQKACS